MKKVSEFMKPYLSIIFGALLLLVYLNWLSTGGSALALGIIAIILASYYLASGILELVLGEKMPSGLKKVFSILTMALFPTFMFAYFLINIIEGNQIMGPTAWVIQILSMVASLSFVVIIVISKIAKKKVFIRFEYLFSSIFVLALLLDVLFDISGNPIVLGNLNIIFVVIYTLYSVIAFNSLTRIKAE